MATNVSIANRALTLAGMKPIVSFTDDSPNAKTVKRMYDDSLKSVLSSYPWSFAIKRVALALLTETPVFTENEQKYVYSLPSDCMRVNDFFPVGATGKIEDGKVYSDTANLYLRYTYLNDNPQTYFAGFVDAFADHLSSEICYNLTGDAKKGEALASKYESVSLPRAKSSDASQGDPQELDQDGWTLARFSGAV